ncbi:MAG: hypothetical protein M9934_01360 [Thermomicrobiales bacterium]|nr:hypothetical protein [Thermomicrobiales bacterium]
MTTRKIAGWILAALVLGSLAACGEDSSPASTAPSTTVPISTAATTITSTSTVTSSVPATATASTVLPEGVILMERSDQESFPTPDVERKMAEMAPTAVIIDGAYPYPTANSAIDSDGDGSYTVEEWKQAMRETYPAYDWPEAYTPSIEDVLAMMSLDMFPAGSTFEVPIEIAALGGIYRCAWQQNWVDAFGVGDQAEMDRSMQMLRAAVLTNPTNIDVISVYAEMYNLAELGDPAKMLRDLEANCFGFNRWVESRSSVGSPKTHETLCALSHMHSNRAPLTTFNGVEHAS